MVHPVLKRKRCFEEDVGLATPTKVSYVAPNARFISAHPIVQIAVPDTSVSSPTATSASLSYPPSAPFNDPFPIIRVLFDLMTPREISCLLKKRTKCLLSCWPPAFPSQPPAAPLPLTSSLSFIDRPESKELTTSTVHAFVTFFRAEDFRTDGMGVTLQDLHTHVKALHTLLSFLSSRELKEIVQARLNFTPGSESERWAAVQGMLDVMRHTCEEDEEGEVPRDSSVLHAVVRDAIENQGKVRVEVGVCTTDEKVATQDRDGEPEASACRDKEDSDSYEDHPQKRAKTTQTILSNDQASQSGLSLRDQAIMAVTSSCELNLDELGSLPGGSNNAELTSINPSMSIPSSTSVSTRSGRQSPSPWSSSSKIPQKGRCREGSSSGSSGLMVARLLSVEQNEEEGWQSDLDAEGDTDMDMDMSEDSEIIVNEQPPQPRTDRTVVDTEGGIPGLLASREREVVSITTINAQVESRKATPLAYQIQSSTETQRHLSDAQHSLSHVFEQSPSTPTQARSSFSPPLSLLDFQIQPWHTDSVQTKGLQSPGLSSLMFQSPPPHPLPLKPGGDATDDSNAAGRWKAFLSTKPTLLQEPVPGLVHTNASAGVSPMPPTAPRGLRAATSLSSVRPPPTFVRAQQPTTSISDIFNTSTSPIKSKDSGAVVKIEPDNTSLKVKKELISARDAAYVFKNMPGGQNGAGLKSGKPLSLNRASAGTVQEWNSISNRQAITMSRHEATTRSALSTATASPTSNPPRSFIIPRGVIPTGPRGTTVFMAPTACPTSNNNTSFSQGNPLPEGFELPSLPPKPNDFFTLDQSHGFQRAPSVSLKLNAFNSQKEFPRKNEPRSRSLSVSSGAPSRSTPRSRSRSIIVCKRHRLPRSRSASSSRSSRGRHCPSSHQRRSSRSSSGTFRSPASPSKLPRSYRRNMYSNSRPSSPMSITRHQHWSPSMERGRRAMPSYSSYQAKKPNKARHDHWSPGRTSGRPSSYGTDDGFNRRASDTLARPVTQGPVRQRWR